MSGAARLGGGVDAIAILAIAVDAFAASVLVAGLWDAADCEGDRIWRVPDLVLTLEDKGMAFMTPVRRLVGVKLSRADRSYWASVHKSSHNIRFCISLILPQRKSNSWTMSS